jgi:two-component system sensor histidine kinase KdpD
VGKHSIWQPPTRRVLVAISTERPADTVLAAGAALAASLQASLLAAFVRAIGLASPPHAGGILDANIRRAEALGATVIEVESDDVADALIAVAEREAVTHVVFGRPRQSGLLDPASTVGAFVRRSCGLEIQVVDDPRSAPEPGPGS